MSDLLVSDDPEYKWIDKLRTPRATNEARHRLFSKLSGELQRKIGKKVCFLLIFFDGEFVFAAFRLLLFNWETSNTLSIKTNCPAPFDSTT